MSSTGTRMFGNRWVFTYNNYVSVDEPKIWFNQSDGEILFLIYEPETASTGTKHLQGYVELKKNPRNKNGRSLKWMRDNVSKNVNWAPARGTLEQNIEYCSKEGNEIRLGEPQDDGRIVRVEAANKKNKSSMDAVKKMIDEGATDTELWQAHFSVMSRYSKAFDAYRRSMKSRERNWHTKLLVLVGPPGTGKSAMAKRIADAQGGAFWVRKPKFGGNLWFDGYDGQDIVIFDEFDGSWMSFEEFLRFADRYPLTVETKGSMVPFVARLLIVTSNKLPRDWWSTEAVDDNRWKAAIRRMSGKLGTVKHLTTLVSFDNDDDDNRDFDELVEGIEGGIINLDGQAISVVDEQEISEDNDFETPEQEIEDDLPDEVDQDDLDYQEDDLAYEEERYGSQAEYNAATAALGASQPPLTAPGTLSGGVIDLDADVDDLAPPATKKLKRTDKAQREWLLEKVPDKRIGKQPNQTKLSFAQKLRKAAMEDPDADFDDK